MKNLIKKIVPSFIFSIYHWKLAFFGALIYGFPSSKLKVIGVTGTKGKTTTCNLIAQLLQGAGLKTGMATTVNFMIGDKMWINEYKQTMLGRFKLQKLLRQMVREGCKYAVIETSSEGILQYRHQFINYSIAVFTNLTPEHIERHGSFEKYKEAKLKLFEQVAKKKDGIGVYNLDDKNVGEFLEAGIVKKVGYDIDTPHPSPFLNRGEGENSKENLPPASPDASRGGQPLLKEGSSLPLGRAREDFKRFQISNIKLSPNKTEFFINGIKFEMSLIGEFNVYNAVAAICVAQSQGIGMEKIKAILAHAKPTPGRLEVVDCGQPFTVIIDYAHEPASLEAVYKTLKIFNPHTSRGEEASPRKIIAVLGGQGGGRDKAKRPILGKISSQYADVVIITNEDPYDEKPEEIIEDVAAGVVFSCHSGLEPESRLSNLDSRLHGNDKKVEVFKILDRREAIKKALSLAQAGDIVILTGKGGEVWIYVENGKKIPWNEREIVEEELGAISFDNNR
ncbi:MAG: hypothetical protein A2174_03040 [Candidatus Portnoybacteria bacterium RBG_13_41_18]|uniref:UDP-N-acetylmuramyl-tripeptide synthetase n=1 Tax=Candidatus Portnoybacteria bacterium RBG_13_41_18 TaxID=1801991 RepID=A0A1G2F7N4_9BACT|nr:MAG: hypothetical protein A2174_03040 [Candidatus Portnoybacteria bacterium RBG_13_41_18]